MNGKCIKCGIEEDIEDTSHGLMCWSCIETENEYFFSECGKE